VGIIACVEVTTTTVGTTPVSTGGPLATTLSPTQAPTQPTSGTTVLPTTVVTTPICTQDMATVGGVYVSSVVYSVQPVAGTNNVDLTSTNGSGVTFPSVPGTTGLFDQNNRPLYNVTLTFNPAGVDSLASIIVSPGTNVNKFAVRFFVPSYPDQPFTFAPEFADIPLYYNSTIQNSQASITRFPQQVPSPISGILISVLSTTDNQ
jgi:hypothetical protein